MADTTLAMPGTRALFATLLCLSPMTMKAARGQEVRIGIAQVFALDGDREGNFRRIENAIAEAKQGGAEIVCLPESCVLGWENPAAHARAHPIPGEDSERLSALARKYRVYLCAGLDEKDGDRLYDSCILVDDQGAILMKHRKVNVLPELMTPPYAVGEGCGVVPTKFGAIGLLICADSFVDGLVREMAGRRPDLLLIPYGWAAPEAKWPGHGASLREIVQKVARTVQCPVVGTDLVGEITNGPWTGQVYGGQSLAVDRSGLVLATCRDRDREVAVVTIRTGAR